jgi:hypothetical protein
MANNIFRRISWNYANGSFLYSGKAFDDIQSRLRNPAEGIPAADPKEERTYTMDPISLGHMDFICDALASAMQKQELTRQQKQVLAAHADWLNLPASLPDFATAVMNLAKVYGDPATAIEKFSELYQATTLPVFKKRFAELGLTPQDIQERLRAAADINPVQFLWMLGGVDSVTELSPTKTWQFIPNIMKISDVLLGSSPDEKPESALLRLAGFDQSEAALKQYHFPLDDDEIRFQEYELAYSLPWGLNDALDARRKELLAEDYRRYEREEEKKASKLPAAGSLNDDYSENGPRSLTQVMRGCYCAIPETFLRIRAKIKGDHAKLTWAAIPAPLREKLERAGFDSAEKIVAALHANVGQQTLTRQIGIILRHSHDKSGYIITSYDVLKALSEPATARFANGTATNLLHERIQALVAAGIDFDDFYGLPKTTPPQTPQEIALARLYPKFLSAIRRHETLKHAVTHEQIAELLDLTPEDLKKIFERPLSLYVLNKEKVAVPSPKMNILETKLGLSFREEWALLQEEQQKPKVVIDAARAQVVTPSMQRTAPQINPWEGISKEVIDAIQPKFATPRALAEAIAINTRAEPSDLVYAVRKLLHNPDSAFLADGRPCEFLSAHLIEVLGIARKDIARIFCHQRKTPKPFDIAGREIQATFTALAMQHPRLQRMTDWKQLKHAHPQADMPALVEQLSRAYQLRSPRDPKPILIPAASLMGLVNVLNIGRGETVKYLPDSIVPVSTWCAAYQAARGHDPLSAEHHGTYNLQLT